LALYSRSSGDASALETYSHLPRLAGVYAVDVLLLLPQVVQRPAYAGVAAGEHLDKLHPTSGERLHPLVRRVGPGLHLGADLPHQFGPLGLDRPDPLFPKLAPSRFELL